MSVPGTNVTAGPFIGDGITVAFTYPNYFIDKADLVVSLLDALGNPTSQTYNVDYTVSGTPDADLGTYSGGGVVTMGVAPAIGQTLVIRRRTPTTQTLTLTTLGQIVAANLEVAQDRHTLIVQEFFDDYLGTLDGPPTVGTFAVGKWFKLRVPLVGGYGFMTCTTAGVAGVAVWSPMGGISL